MEPVQRHGEFLVVHAVAGHGHVDRPGLGVLADVALEADTEHVENVVRGTEGVEQRPVQLVLGGIIRPVIAPPSRHTQQISRMWIEILGEEIAAGLGLAVEQVTLEQGPARWCDGGVEVEQGIMGGGHGGPYLVRTEAAMDWVVE